MEETAILNGENAYNAHFGECITAIGDIDDDGYQGQKMQSFLPATRAFPVLKEFSVTVFVQLTFLRKTLDLPNISKIS